MTLHKRGMLGEKMVMQRVDHVMDGLLVSAIMIVPFYMLYKVGVFFIN